MLFHAMGVAIFFVKFIVPLNIFRSVFGCFSWQTPHWPKIFTVKAEREKALGLLIKYRGPIVIGVVTLLAAFSGVYYWLNRPTPQIKLATSYLTAPSVTRFYKDSAGAIQQRVSNLLIRFDEGAAPLKHIGKEISKNIGIRPEVLGKWKWLSAKELVFVPQNIWPLGEEYKVELDQEIIAPQFKLKNSEHSFRTDPFAVSFNSGEFYENPENPTDRKVIFSINFNYPVDEKSLEKNIVIKQIKYLNSEVQSEKQLKFNIIYDELRYNAYIHTENIEIPKHEGRVSIEVLKGVRPEISTNSSETIVRGSQRVPGLFNYFHMLGANIQVVDNIKGISEHIAVIESSTGVAASVLRENIGFYELPKYKDDRADDPTDWLREKHNLKSDFIQKNYLKLKFNPQATVETFPKIQSFKIQANIDRYVAIIIPKGIKSGSGIELQESYLEVVKVKPFPKKIKILQEGSILQLKGEKKLSVYSMNIKKMKIRIGQVLHHQIQHLITQGSGEQRKTRFDNYQFNEKNLAHFSEEIRVLKSDMLTPQYEVIDFVPYLERIVKGQKVRGLFFLELSSVDASRAEVRDRRLILITDLGVIVKKDKAGEQHVFVQSLATGNPLSGVNVEILGQNGLPLLSGITNRDGYTKFPRINRKDIEPGQRAIGYLLKKGSDITYLKNNDYDRQLNYSRFDIGGVYESSKANALKGFLFSDRGIYRPGENVKIGHIVKAGQWQKDLADLPIRIKVTDSRSRIIVDEKQKLSKLGLGEFSFNLSANAPTGSYNISLYNIVKYQLRRERRERSSFRDEFIGSTDIKVQEFTPDKLKILSVLEPKKALGWVKPDGIKGKLNLKNLYGLAAAGHHVRYQYLIAPETLRFAKYKDYIFDNPNKEVEPFESEWIEGETDELGNASFQIALDRFAKKVFRLRFIAEGFEKASGRSVVGTDSTLVSPHDFLLGVKGEGEYNYIQAATKKGIHFIAINSSLQQVQVNNLHLHLKKVRYVNVLTKRYNGSYGYESVKTLDSISRVGFSVAVDGSYVSLDTATPGDFVVAIENTEGSVLSEFKYSVIGDGGLARSLNRNTELQVKLNKSDFEIGEEIEFELKAPYLGAGLITIERDKIYAYKWFKIKKKTSVLKIKIPKGIAGNAYLNINFTRNKEAKEIYMGPFSYGAFPFTISRKSKTEDINLKVPELTKPGLEYTVKYSSTHKSDIVIFAVNEGILQYAKYKNPNPLEFFLTKRSLGVKTWQVLDLLLPENSLVESQFAAGGGYGSGAKHLNPFKRRNRRPIAFWSGVLAAGPREKQWKFKIPGHFNGEIRVIAVALNKSRIGRSVQKSLVQADLILSTTTPTFATPGDEFTVPMSVVNNISEKLPTLPIDISLLLSPQLESSGPLQELLNIEKGLDKTHKFKVKVKDQLGSGKIIYKAKYANYSNEIEDTLSIRPSSSLKTDYKLGFVTNDDIVIDTRRKVYAEHARRSLSLSATPMSFAPLIKGLLSANPYSCTEQLISKGFPYMLLGENNSGEIQKITNIIQSRQEGNGQIQLFPGSQNDKPFISLYALHFLQEAKERGFSVSHTVLRKVGHYVLENFEQFSSLREQAYGIYLLSRLGIVTTPYLKKIDGAVADMLKLYSSKKVPLGVDLTLAYLAATYKLLKNEKLAHRYIKMVNLHRPEADSAYAYYSLPQSRAQILYLLAKHFPAMAKNITGDTIGQIFKDIKHLNTLNSSYLLLALDAWEKQFISQKLTDQVEIQQMLNGKWLVLDGKKLTGESFSFAKKAQKLKLINKSDWPLFFTYHFSGFDISKVAKSSKGIEIYKEILGEDGKITDRVKQGEKITVQLTFRSTSEKLLDNLVVVDLFPAGFVAVLDEKGKAQGENFIPSYADTREDRVLVYTAANNQTRKITYQLKATNIGTYSLPGAFVEDMYNLENHASSAEGTIQIVP